MLVIPALGTGVAEFLLENAVLLNGTNEYFTRTPSVAGNRKKWLYDCWVKGVTAGTGEDIFSGGTDTNNWTGIDAPGGPTFRFLQVVGGSAVVNVNTTAKFNDPAAWRHLAVLVDTTQATASDRVKMYVNGTQITDFVTATYPTLNQDLDINSTNVHSIGARVATDLFAEGYIAYPRLIDGATPAISDILEIDGIWIAPKELSAAAIADGLGGNVVPVMTGFTTPSGTVTGTTTANAQVWNIFDGTLAPSYYVMAGSTGFWQYQFPTAKTIVGYYIAMPVGDTDRDIVDWTLEGSNNGSTYTTLDTVTGESWTGFRNQHRYFACDTTGSYSYYRVTVTANNGNGSYTQVQNMQMVEASTGFGTNGGVYAFSDGASLGADSSGNGNNYTPTNIDSTNQTADSPTDVEDTAGNSATGNPLFAHASGNKTTYRDGNLTIDAGAVYSVCGIGVSSGKWYYEFTYLSTGGSRLGAGWCNGDRRSTGGSVATFDAWGVDGFNGNKYNPGASVNTTYGSSLTTNDVLMVALDADNGDMWWGKNGTWFNSGDPAAATNAAFTGQVPTTGEFFPAGASGSGTDEGTFNFGANGFTYTPPTGFSALATQSLPAPDTGDYTDVFDVVLAQEADLLSTLATSRSGWSSWVEICKNRDATETWFARFSHDSSNEHFWGGFSASATGDYQAVRTLAGTNNWTGFVLNGDATGVAIGSVSHTNGANTTITHNLGNADCCILLFDRDTAGSRPIWMYHPEFTAGDLYDITNYSAEVLDSAIENVGANSFDIDTAEATGTYDYIVMTPDSGCISLSSAVPNGSTDGPFIYNGLSPIYLWTVVRNSAGGMLAYDAASETYNPRSSSAGLYHNAAPPSVTANIDLLSNGQKLRSTATALNWTSGDKIVQLVFGSPFQGGDTLSQQGRAR